MKRKDLLGLEDVSQDEIESILQTATQMKKILLSGNKKTPHLQGKSVITLFYENSTRTRVSFDFACKYLSASSSNVSASSSSVSKGETLLDTARTLDRMAVDVLVMRHPMAGSPHLMAKHVKASVINAGDGMHEHPTQALLDIMTIKEKFGTLKNLKITITGDVLHSRVAKSNIYGMTAMGADVHIAAPLTMLPYGIDQLGVTVDKNIDKAVAGANVIMGLRIQKERQSTGLFPSIREYHKYFGINERRVSLADKNVMIMHPGPVNRGAEISSMVMSEDNCVIDEQVTNGVAIRMALLFMLTRENN